MGNLKRVHYNRDNEDAVSVVIREVVEDVGLKVCTIPKVLFCPNCAFPLALFENNSRSSPSNRNILYFSQVSLFIANQLGIPVFIFVVFSNQTVNLTYLNPRLGVCEPRENLSVEEWTEFVVRNVPARCPNCHTKIVSDPPAPVNTLPEGDDVGYNTVTAEIFTRNTLPANWVMGDVDFIVYDPTPPLRVVALVEGTTVVNREKKVWKLHKLAELLGVPVFVLFFNTHDEVGWVVKVNNQVKISPPDRLVEKVRVVRYLREVLLREKGERQKHN